MLNMKLLLLHPHMIVVLSFCILHSPDYTISEKFALIKDYIDGLPLTIAHDNFDECDMHVLAALLAIIMREELYLHLSMFPI